MLFSHLSRVKGDLLVYSAPQDPPVPQELTERQETADHKAPVEIQAPMAPLAPLAALEYKEMTECLDPQEQLDAPALQGSLDLLDHPYVS